MPRKLPSPFPKVCRPTPYHASARFTDMEKPEGGFGSICCRQYPAAFAAVLSVCLLSRAPKSAISA